MPVAPSPPNALVVPSIVGPRASALTSTTGKSPLWMAWGTMQFEVIQGWESESLKHSYSWPEFDIIESIPSVQWTGLSLRTITFEMLVHIQYDDVELRIFQFARAGRNHEVRALVRADGFLRGWYAMTEFVVTGMQTAGLGWPVAVRINITLKEVPPPKPAKIKQGSTKTPNPVNPIPINPVPLNPLQTQPQITLPDQPSIFPNISARGVSPSAMVRSTSSTSVSSFLPSGPVITPYTNVLEVPQVSS